MAFSNSALEYRKQAVNGSSPVGLVVMLYDGALRFMETGRQAILDRDIEAQSKALIRAQKIVMHLMSTLDMDQGGDISTNLMSLYAYVLNNLVMANVQDQTDKVDEAIRTFSELRKGWAQLDVNLRTDSREQLVAA